MLPLLRTTFPSFPVARLPIDQFDALVDRFFGTDGERLRPSWAWASVPVSVWQDDNNIYVEAELPGVTENEVDLTVDNGVLTIKAERHDQEGRTYLYHGRGFGRFERAVTLPENIDSEHVEATLSAGVLRVVLPKHPSARPKKITLKAS
jgi:HSP20 family protein